MTPWFRENTARFSRRRALLLQTGFGRAQILIVHAHAGAGSCPRQHELAIDLEQLA
jgi:hypothetical protein